MGFYFLFKPQCKIEETICLSPFFPLIFQQVLQRSPFLLPFVNSKDLTPLPRVRLPMRVQKTAQYCKRLLRQSMLTRPPTIRFSQEILFPRPLLRWKYRSDARGYQPSPLLRWAGSSQISWSDRANRTAHIVRMPIPKKYIVNLPAATP